jgi:flagellar assembly protein FliH
MPQRNGLTVQLSQPIGRVGVVGAVADEQQVDVKSQVPTHIYAQLLREVSAEIREDCLRQIREEEEAELQARREALEQDIAARQQGLQQAQQAIESVVAELTQLRDDLQVEAQTQLPELIAELTSRILGQAIEAGDYNIDVIVREALKELPPRGQIVVRMNPDDHAKSDMAARGAGQGAAAAVQFVSDPNISRGGCVVESSEGRVDATTEAGIDEIERTVRDSMESA